MRQVLSICVTLALIFGLSRIAGSNETPQMVVVSELPDATFAAPPPSVAPKPMPARVIGLVTAPMNIKSRTAMTKENPFETSPSSRLRAGFDGGFGGYSPTDIGGAVGSRDVVSALNGFYYFYTKSGILLKSITGTAFWCSGVLAGCPGNNLDPRMVYDFAAERWVSSALAGGGLAAATTWLAVSQTPDPTGAWYLYAIPSCGSAYATDPGDQPRLGVNSQWIVVKDASCHRVSSFENTLHVFDKKQLYNGATLQVGVNQFEFTDAYDLDTPVVTFAKSTINNREYLAASNVVGNGTIQVIYSHLEGPVAAPLLYQTTEVVTLSATGNGFVPEGFQFGCSTPCIGSEDDSRINSASVSAGANGDKYVVVTFSVGEPINNPNTSDVIAVATDTRTGRAVSHDIAATSPSVFGYPSIALLSHTNKAIIGYAFFSETNYPAAEENQWNIGSNTVSTGTTFAQSTVAYTFTSRWGDFSTTVLDPSNRCVVWAAQDYDYINYYTQNAWWQEIQLWEPRPGVLRMPPDCGRR
jgi:hypothetical protein